MQSVGEMLLAARLGSGRTLEDVSAKTRITLKNLKAIERDELSAISSRFFYKSFVRQYAEQLNLNFTQIAEAVQAAADKMPRPLMPGEDGATLPKPVHSVAPKRGRLRWLQSLASLMLVLVACSTVYGMWQNSRSHLRASMSSLLGSTGRPANILHVPSPAVAPPRTEVISPASAKTAKADTQTSHVI